jgi:hypothetical protein
VSTQLPSIGEDRAKVKLVSMDVTERPGGLPVGGALEMAGKVIAVSAALLPFVGCGVRLVAFRGRFEGAPVSLAWETTVPDLIATALLPVFAVVSLVGMLFVGVFEAQRGLQTVRSYDPYNSESHVARQGEGMPEDPSAEDCAIAGQIRDDIKTYRRRLNSWHRVWHEVWFSEGSRIRRLSRRVLLVLPIGFIGGATLFLPPWPTAPIYIAVCFGSAYWAARIAITYPQATLWSYVPIVVVIFLAVSVMAGLDGRVPGVEAQRYTFRASAPAVLRDGIYAELGRSDGFLDLMLCSDRSHSVIQVRESDVVIRRPNAAHLEDVIRPSLWQVLKGEPVRVGLLLPCNDF